jgi:hypothetical protein
VHVFASVACTVNVELPAVVAVPDNTPAEDRLRPPGKVPALFANVYGPVPPLASMVWLYTHPTAPVGNVLGDSVIVGHPAGFTTTV